MSATGTTPAEKTREAARSTWVPPEAAGDEREDEPVAESSPGALRAVVLTCIAVTQLAWIGGLAYLAHRLLF